MEAYLGRVQGLIISLTGVLPAKALDLAQHLAEHGEPAEGLLQLAWAISNGDHRVPRWVVDEIRGMTDGLVPADLLPPDLDRHAS